MKTAAHKKQKPPASAPKDGQLNKDTGLIESEFVRLLRDRIIGAGETPNWPSDLSDDNPEHDAIDDIKAAVELLFLKCEGKSLPSKIHPAKSLPRIVRKLLNDSNWPNEPPRIPERFHPGVNRPNRLMAFRRYEVACAFNIMMLAWHIGGPGGSGSEWPPQRP